MRQDYSNLKVSKFSVCKVTELENGLLYLHSSVRYTSIANSCLHYSNFDTSTFVLEYAGKKGMELACAKYPLKSIAEAIWYELKNF